MKNLSFIGDIVGVITAFAFFAGILATLAMGDAEYIITSILLLMVGLPFGVMCKVLGE